MIAAKPEKYYHFFFDYIISIFRYFHMSMLMLITPKKYITATIRDQKFIFIRHIIS